MNSPSVPRNFLSSVGVTACRQVGAENVLRYARDDRDVQARESKLAQTQPTPCKVPLRAMRHLTCKVMHGLRRHHGRYSRAAFEGPAPDLYGPEGQIAKDIAPA